MLARFIHAFAHRFRQGDKVQRASAGQADGGSCKARLISLHLPRKITAEFIFAEDRGGGVAAVQKEED